MSFTAVVGILALAFVQNISFSMVSRSRNLDHDVYHVTCSVFSNGIWFAASHYLIVTNQMSWGLAVPYILGTVAGSLTGSKISLRIEKWLGIKKS